MSVIENQGSERFDDKILAYLPHRPPMLLVNKIVEISQSHAIAEVWIDEQAPFATEQGVSAVVGIEYMGQTAALIAGYQLEQGLTEPHLGFLLGTRAYTTELDYFPLNTVLQVECREKALVGDSLATFDCIITRAGQAQAGDQESIARANLSVFRKPLAE